MSTILCATQKLAQRYCNYLLCRNNAICIERGCLYTNEWVSENMKRKEKNFSKWKISTKCEKQKLLDWKLSYTEKYYKLKHRNFWFHKSVTLRTQFIEMKHTLGVTLWKLNLEIFHFKKFFSFWFVYLYFEAKSHSSAHPFIYS